MVGRWSFPFWEAPIFRGYFSPSRLVEDDQQKSWQGASRFHSKPTCSIRNRPEATLCIARLRGQLGQLTMVSVNISYMGHGNPIGSMGVVYLPTWMSDFYGKSRWWQLKYFYFHLYLGKWSIIWWAYFSNGLEPPTWKLFNYSFLNSPVAGKPQCSERVPTRKSMNLWQSFMLLFPSMDRQASYLYS